MSEQQSNNPKTSRYQRRHGPPALGSEEDLALRAFHDHQKAYSREMQTQYRRNQIGAERAEKLGLSNCFNLHAHLNLKLWKNGEAKAFASVSGYKISGNNEDGSNSQGRKAGVEIDQVNLSGHAKRSIRVASHEYNLMHKDKELCKAEGWRAFSSFSSLTFRRITPRDHIQAKDIFRAYLQRLYRAKQKELHYIWVAENQKGKILKDGRKSYRKIHGDVIHFHLLTPEFIDKRWLNRNWNECVMENFKKNGLISDLQFMQWQAELTTWECYMDRLDRWREMTKAGMRKRGKPKSPGIGQMMLTPNVRAVWNPGRYMSKYMSKDGENLKGHLWNISKRSRELTIPVVTRKKHESIVTAQSMVTFMYAHMKKAGSYVSPLIKDPNDHPIFWTPDGPGLMNMYFTILEQYDINYLGEFTPKRGRPGGPPDRGKDRVHEKDYIGAKVEH